MGGEPALRVEARSEDELGVVVPSGVEPGVQPVAVDLGAGPVEVGSVSILNSLLPGDSEIRPGSVVVRLRTGIDPAGVAIQHDAVYSDPVFSHRGDERLDRYHRFDVEPGSEEVSILDLAADPEVEWAEPIFLAGLDDTIPNDPLYGQQWALPNAVVPAAWDYSNGNPNVTVAIIDTGVDGNHPDLAGRVYGNRTFTVGSVACGHGTHVAGIAGARMNNSVGVAGAGETSGSEPTTFSHLRLQTAPSLIPTGPGQEFQLTPWSRRSIGRDSIRTRSST